MTWTPDLSVTRPSIYHWAIPASGGYVVTTTHCGQYCRRHTPNVQQCCPAVEHHERKPIVNSHTKKSVALPLKWGIHRAPTCYVWYCFRLWDGLRSRRRDQWFDDELINNRNASAELTENMYAPCKDEEPVCCEVVNCFGVGQPEFYRNSLRWLSHSH